MALRGGGERTQRSPRRCITLSYIYMSVFCIRLVFTSATFRPGGPERHPSPSHSSHVVPSPQCLLLKVTQSKLGQSSQVKQKRRGPIAVETGLCSVCLLCLTAHHPPALPPPCPFLSAYPRLFITSYHPPPPPPTPAPTNTHMHTTSQHPPDVARAGNVVQKRATQISGEATGRRD